METQSMRGRVTSLLRKANDSAASEAEAQTCMNMAMNLMAKFGLTMVDVTGDEAEKIGRSDTDWQRGRGGDAMIYAQSAIAAFTSTRASFRGNASVGTSMTYYGYEAERELALWLHAHIRNSIEVESRLYNPPTHDVRARAKDRKSFAVFMAKRIAARLYSMAETLDDAGRGTGTDVLIIKNAKLDEHFEGLGLGKCRVRRRAFYRDGASAGATAGDKVSLHRPVSDESSPLRITS